MILLKTLVETRKILKKRNDNEHQHQKAFFEWCEVKSRYEIPELKWAFAVPNGGARHISVARKLKAEGVKSGVPDIFIPVSRHNFHGLFLEMKSPEGKVSSSQIEWMNGLKKQGYFVYTCYSSNEAIDIVEYYFGKKGIK